MPVLAPGAGKTKTGRLWVYVRDERPHGGDAQPAAAYFYSPDRKGDHPQSHLAGFAGHLVADAYAGFNALYSADRQPGPVIPVACWAHARRKFHDIYAAKQSPVAQEALERIAALYAVEKVIRGRPPDERERSAKALWHTDVEPATLRLQRKRRCAVVIGEQRTLKREPQLEDLASGLG